MENNKARCPFCQSDKFRNIIYGLLEFRNEEDREEFEKKYFMGGCIIEDESPAFHCDNCGKEFGKLKDFRKNKTN